MICLVVSGAGRSTVGEHTFDWSQHDVFTIPHWTFASHEAQRRRRRSVHRLRQVGVRAARPACARNCNSGDECSRCSETFQQGIGAPVSPRRGSPTFCAARALRRRHHMPGELPACWCARRTRMRASAASTRAAARVAGRRRGVHRRRHGGRRGRPDGAAVDRPIARRQADGRAAALGAGARDRPPCRRAGRRGHRRNARSRRTTPPSWWRSTTSRCRRRRRRAPRRRKGAPQLHEAAPGNVCFRWARGDEAAVREAFAAPHMVRVDLVNNRLIGAAIEPRAVLGDGRAGTGGSRSTARRRCRITSAAGHRAARHSRERAARDCARRRRRLRLQGQALSRGEPPRLGGAAAAAGR